MNDNFYRAFEDRYRGSRNLIKERLKAYFPFLKALSVVYPESDSIDLGCGRGEWLEILKEFRFCEKGVDLDLGMLSSCIEIGLNVEKKDALNALKSLPDESQAIVSAFHLVEHISFDCLQELAVESLRVLKPGGIMILETPNPENILVATSNFYLDPTHQRPIPPMLLSFTVEHAGFARVKTVRLQESQDLINKANIKLSDIIGGVSPDYAVIAQKKAAPEIFSATDSAFETNMGVSLSDLLARWETHFDRLEQSLIQNHALLNSTSWRITAPLRSINQFIKKVMSRIRNLRLAATIKQYSISSIHAILVWIYAQPILKKINSYLLHHFPGLKKPLSRILGRQSSFLYVNPIWRLRRTHRSELIYRELKQALEDKGGS